MRDRALKYRAELMSFLHKDALKILNRWTDEAIREVSADGDRANNIPTGCVIHAYKAMLFSNLEPEEFNADRVGQFLGSLAHVRAHHSFGQVLRNIELDIEDATDTKKPAKKKRMILKGSKNEISNREKK